MIILVRHGEATHHTLGLTGGWTDSSLTDKGRQQAQLVGEILRHEFKDKELPLIYASDLKRAVDTAQIIATCLGVNLVEKLPFLREKNNGSAANMTEEAAKAYRISYDSKTLDTPTYVGGETRRSFYQRVATGFETLIRTERDIIIVSHKGAIQNMLFAWLGLDIAEVAAKNFSVDIAPASITVLGYNKWQERCIALLNYPAGQKGTKSLKLKNLPTNVN